MQFGVFNAGKLIDPASIRNTDTGKYALE